MRARNLRLWPVKWISIAVQIKCGWWCWGAEGQGVVVMNPVGSLLVEAEVQQSSNELSFGPCPRHHLLQPSHYPPSGVRKRGDICCSIAILRNKNSSLWHLCPDPGQSQEDAGSPDLIYSGLWAQFADLADIPWGLRLSGWKTMGPGFEQRVVKLWFAALSFWHEMVSGSEWASGLNVCLLGFFGMHLYI